METRANYVLIGAFTLAVIAAAFGFVLWFQSLHTTKARSPLRMVFEGPASGLRNGGSVNFNGIRIGEVVSREARQPASRRRTGDGREQRPDPQGHPGRPRIPGPDRRRGDLAQGRRGGRASGAARRGRRSGADRRSERAAGRHRVDPRHAAERQPDRRRQPGIGEELAAKPRDLHRRARAQLREDRQRHAQGRRRDGQGRQSDARASTRSRAAPPAAN